MTLPEVHPRVVFAELVADFITAGMTIILPLLTVFDAIGAVLGKIISPVLAIVGSRSLSILSIFDAIRTVLGNWPFAGASGRWQAFSRSWSGWQLTCLGRAILEKVSSRTAALDRASTGIY
jgi:hypothetical protein